MSGWVSAAGEFHDHGKPARVVRRTTCTDEPVEPLTPDLIGEERAPLSLPAPGERIGPYEVIRELGRGGMGAVFAARDTRLGRKVAIKLFAGDHGPERTARFILEAKATARCGHENIAAIHEVGERSGHPFMVLEHLQGAPLTRLLREGRKLPAVQAVELMVPVVRALTLAHAHNIVHSDLKPDNIFMTDSGTIKVLDFGIAKLVQGGDEDGPGLVRGGIAKASGPAKGNTRELTRPELARRGVLVGTLPYMSPEQWCAGGGTVDHQTDLWAVGVILFEMVAGHHPLAPRSGWELMIAGVIEEPMPSVRGVCPSLPDELADVIDRCLEKPKARRIGSAAELLDALEPLLPGRYVRRLRSDERPYAGVTPFQESDAHRFFGRAREVAAAVARLRTAPLLGVVGPSGVGKSSFVRAGIVPALEASGEPWSTLVVRPGRAPMAALADALGPIVSAGARTSTSVLFNLSHQQSLVERLYAEPGFLGAVLRSRARSHGQHVLLVVDQLEELYQVADARERQAFTACLSGVCDDAATPLRLVLSLRSDFLDDVAEDPALLAELTRGLLFLAPPSRDGLRDALIQPAEMAGYQFEEPAMVESMLDHLEHAPGALRLLQFAAGQLWEMRDRERRLLTSESYARIGGIAGALASHADTVLAICPAREQVLVRALILRLVTSERTRAVVPVSELHDLSPDPAEVHRVIDRLVRSRLVVGRPTAGDSGDAAAGGSLELVHESLIQTWPLLRRWLDETQEDAGFLEQLRDAAGQWQAQGRPPGLLWRGDAMQEARRWHGRYRGELPEPQRAYLTAVLARSARVTRRRHLAVTAVTGLLSAVIVVAAVVALVLIRDARQDATAQAHRAQEQLDLTRAAEAGASAERAKAVEATRQLASKNAALAAAIEAAERAWIQADHARAEAEAARQRAEESRRHERRSRRPATESAQPARAPAAGAKAASEPPVVRPAEERRRSRELPELTRGAKVVSDRELD